MKKTTPPTPVTDQRATLKLDLKAASGYRSTTTARVTVDQWARINDILNEEPK